MSYLKPFVRKADYSKADLVSAMEDFAQTALRLDEVWTGLENSNGDEGREKYPFALSFEEIAHMIWIWKEEQQELLLQEPQPEPPAPDWLNEFGRSFDVPQEILDLVPEVLSDESERQNASPSFTSDVIRVFVRMPEYSPRYTVCDTYQPTRSVFYEGDDLDTVLQLIHESYEGE